MITNKARLLDYRDNEHELTFVTVKTSNKLQNFPVKE